MESVQATVSTKIWVLKAGEREEGLWGKKFQERFLAGGI
jgi:hypothetical protein